jgi:quinol monooxygenase YgiN
VTAARGRRAWAVLVRVSVSALSVRAVVCKAGPVIRNIVLVKLKPRQDPWAVAQAQQAFLDLNCPGTLSYAIGDDLGLREGNWSFAIVADFTDADAYRAYDRDPAHTQARAGLSPLTEQIARIQFEVP